MDRNSILLSICIPTYNRLDHIKRQLDFFKQEGAYFNEEIQFIVSDNHSLDGTGEWLRDFAAIYKIQIITQSENVGGPANFVAIQEYAIGEYIWLPGDDDRLCKGILKKILDTLKKHSDIAHIFINYACVKGSKLINENVYKGESGYYKSGYLMFEQITKEGGLGLLMFQTANIYRREFVNHTNRIIEKHGETESFSRPLGYSLYCSMYPGYLIPEVMIEDEMASTSWDSLGVMVWCRDMIAMCDVVGTQIGMGEKVRALLISNLPRMCPEYEYIIRGRKFSKDNYAWKMYKKYFKKRLVLDAIIYPIYTGFRILRKILCRFIGKWGY